MTPDDPQLFDCYAYDCPGCGFRSHSNVSPAIEPLRPEYCPYCDLRSVYANRHKHRAFNVHFAKMTFRRGDYGKSSA